MRGILNFIRGCLERVLTDQVVFIHPGQTMGCVSNQILKTSVSYNEVLVDSGHFVLKRGQGGGRVPLHQLAP